MLSLRLAAVIHGNTMVNMHDVGHVWWIIYRYSYAYQELMIGYIRK